MNALIICGLSFSGKSTLAKTLNADPNQGFEEVVSSTTRSMRKGEVDGRDYHFLSREEFKKGIDNNDFVDYADVHGNFYGSRFSDYQSIYDAGKIPMLVCDPNGPKNLAAFRENNPSFNFTSIFINVTPTDAAERALQRLDNDLFGLPLEKLDNKLLGLDGDILVDFLNKNAKRMTKLFHPDQEVCESICRQHLMGNGKDSASSKLARFFIEQQTLACQGKKVQCVEHEWISDYPYDLVIKEGINQDRQASAIHRIKTALNIAPVQTDEKEVANSFSESPTSSR